MSAPFQELEFHRELKGSLPGLQNSAMGHMLSRMSLAHALWSNFFKIHLNIILLAIRVDFQMTSFCQVFRPVISVCDTCTTHVSLKG